MSDPIVIANGTRFVFFTMYPYRNFFNWFLLPNKPVVRTPLKPLPPSTGPENSFGERDCSHLNFKFEDASYILQNTRFPYPSTPMYKEHKYATSASGRPSTWLHYDTVTPWGDAGSWLPAEPYDNTTHYWEFVGDVCYSVGWCQFGTTWRVDHQRARLTGSPPLYSGVEFSSYSNSEEKKPTLGNHPPTREGPWSDWIKAGTSQFRFGYISGGTVVAQGWSDIQCRRVAAHITQWAREKLNFPDPDDYLGTLSQQCAEGAKALDTNLFTLLPEIVEMRSGIKGLFEQITDPKLFRSVKKLADLELSLKYGVQLTVKDVIKQARRLSQERVVRNGCARTRGLLTKSGTIQYQGWSIPYTTSYHMKVWYDPTPNNVLQNVIWNALSFGAIPSLQNAWDMIPFSFVVDWFVGVSDALAQMDANTLISVLDVRCVLTSRRVVYSVPAVAVPDLSHQFNGIVHFVDYTRRDIGSLVVPKPSLSGSQPFHNYVEGAAILVQLLKKK